jgi:serine/threonine protein phosphatase PrpC
MLAGAASRGGVGARGGLRWCEAQVTRSIGDARLKPPLSGEPEMHHVELEEGAQFFVLASDGVWGVLTPQDAVDMVARPAPAAPSPAQTIRDGFPMHHHVGEPPPSPKSALPTPEVPNSARSRQF